MKASLISISAGSLLCALAMAQPSPPRYTVTDLGKIGGPPAQPYFITNNGLIGGGVAVSDTAWNAMLWFDGIQWILRQPAGLEDRIVWRMASMQGAKPSEERNFATWTRIARISAVLAPGTYAGPSYGKTG